MLGYSTYLRLRVGFGEGSLTLEGYIGRNLQLCGQYTQIWLIVTQLWKHMISENKNKKKMDGWILFNLGVLKEATETQMAR